MVRRFLTVLAVVGLLAAVACAKPGVRANLRNFPNPVMISPIIRLGDGGAAATSVKEFGRFEAKTETSLAGGGGQRVEGNYVVYESYRSETWKDDIAHQMSKAAAGRRDLLIVVDDIEAGNWSHWSIIALMSDWIKMEGRAIDPAALPKGRK